MASQNFYEIETARLRLRPLIPDDLDAVHRLWTEPEVRKYLWDDEIISRETVAGLISGSAGCFEERGFELWTVVHKEDGGLIGFCGFWRFEDGSDFELVYGISPAYWGKGFATETGYVAIRHGFEVAGMDYIPASADTPNTASLRVMQKIGMRREKREIHEGRDTTYYGIFRENFRSANGSTVAPG